MMAIVGTEDGRIFMGGNDGCVYELVYQVRVASEGNVRPSANARRPPSQREAEFFGLARKCRKINYSQSALQYLVPAAIAGLFGAAEC